MQLRACLSLLFSEKTICPKPCLSVPPSKCVKLPAWKKNIPFSQTTRRDNFQALDRYIEYRDLKIPWTWPRKTVTGSKFGRPNLMVCFSRAKVAVTTHALSNATAFFTAADSDSRSNPSSAKETSQWCHVFKKQFVRFCV